MKLVTAKKPEETSPTIKRGALVLFARAGKEKDLRKLEASNYKLYLYITDTGSIGTTAVLSKQKPPVIAGLKAFSYEAEYSFDVDSYPSFENENQSRMALETLALRGSRISPTYMQVSKVVMLPDGISAYVEGPVVNAIDPRLEHLDPEESTVFGDGQFEANKVKGHCSGAYVNTATTPWAEDIKRIAEQQHKVFEKLVEARKTNANVENLEKMLEVSRRLLKPHAYQVYKYENDHLYFVNTKGNWEAVSLGGLRDIDAQDRMRVRKYLEATGKTEQDMSKEKGEMYKAHPLDRFALKNMGVALEREARRRQDRDEVEYASRVEKNKKRTPLDGPLGADDLPGLRAGVNFLPHQPYILSALDDSMRQLVDADPGAGKAFIIICDVLRQMKQGKLKRPIVVMPEDVIPQFAQEVKMFSELNPWIITTESIEKWSNGDADKFFADAANAPPNTVFLTSYNWLGQNKTSIPVGVVKVVVNAETGVEEERYATSSVYHNPNKLLTVIGIDALYVDECFSSNANVLMADGRTERIGKLVNSKSQEKVLAYSMEMQKFVPRQITGHIRLPRTQDWWELDTLFGRKIQCTPNHEFYTQSGLVRADEIKTGGHVLARGLVLTKVQRQCVLGSLMGDAVLGQDPKKRMARFMFKQSDKQKDYCLLKQQIMKPFILTEAKKSVNGGYGDFIWSANTQCLPVFDEIWSLVYLGKTKKGNPGRKVTQALLDQLDEIGLAFWFMDDGSMQWNTLKSGSKTPGGFQLATNGFDHDEQLLMQAWLKSRWDLDVSIERDSRGRGYFLMGRGGKVTCEKLIDLIKPYVHKSLAYKLGGRDVGSFWQAYEAEAEWGLVPCKVTYSGPTRVKSTNKDNEVYCLVVEDDHNFVCEGKLVSNCHVLKNESNQVYATVVMAKVPVVRGLTGTIMPGNLVDVTGPMGVIHSGVFGSTDEFLAEHSKDGTPHLYNDDAPKKIRATLSDYGVPQVRQTEWAHILPQTTEQTHYVHFSTGQQQAYDLLLETALDEIKRDPSLQAKLEILERELQESGGEGEALDINGPLLSKFIPLEVFLNSPAAAQKWLRPILSDKDAVSPKTDIITDICLKHLATKDCGKILIFCQFRESAHGIFDALPPDLKEMAAYYEGGMVDVLERLKNPSDPLKIMVGVDRTLRVGHNIQSVNCIIHADLLWLNGDMGQRKARAARPGQTRPVAVHYVITEGSAEVLKMARLISADHMISKANSDFDDKHVLQPVSMSLQSMKTFRHRDQLKPYVERKAEIVRQTQSSAETAKSKYGERLLSPKGNAPITQTFGDAKKLRKVPTSRTFIGDEKNIDFMVEEELKELPAEPHAVKLLEFHVKKFNEDWALVSYYTSDPQGWLRRLQFKLLRTMWFVEVGSKAGALAMLDKIRDKRLDIANYENLVDMINSSRVTNSGVKNTIIRTEKASRNRTRTSVAAASEEMRGEIAVNYGLFDGTPVLWVDTMNEGDTELKALRSLGFRAEPASWYLFVSRSSLNRFFTRLQQVYPDVRIAQWDKLKADISQAFRGLNLSDFDSIGAKNE